MFHWLINIFKAVLRSPFFIVSLIKSKPVSLETATKRLQICYECNDLDLITRQCTHCWCFVRLKSQWQDEKCPLGNWEK